MTEIQEVYKCNTPEQEFYVEAMPVPFVRIHGKRNAIEFEIQQGPIKEVGVNGCQIDDVIEFARRFIESRNEAFPCAENEYVLQCLQQALDGLKQRKLNRESRGVEGTNAS